MTHLRAVPPSLQARIRLALSVIGSRRWHPDDQAAIQEVEQALNGATIEQLRRHRDTPGDRP